MAQVLCPVLIGRDAELQQLEAALAEAGAGRGGCAVLSGEPGIGKSRLVRELIALAEAEAMTVVAGRALPSSSSAPYRPLTEALFQLLRDRSLPQDAGLAPWLPALAGLLPGIVVPDLGAAASPAIRGEAVLQLLRRLAPRGLVMVLEDLHWADPDTVALADYLADNLAGEPVLCVMTVRSEPVSPALEAVRRQRGRRGVLHLPLERLDATQVCAMVEVCAPNVEPEILARVQHAAEGVPLLVEEVLASPGLPESFAETVRERLAAFSPQDRSVIEAAAVLGRHFDWELLPAMTGRTGGAVAGALAGAVDRLLVSTDGTAFRFRHALTRDAVLEGLLPPRRRDLAAAALAALDAAHPALDGAAVELAADLAVRAGERRRAGGLLLRSGRQSLDMGALATAIDTLREAAGLLEGTDEQAAAELALVEGLALAGRVDEAAAAGARLVARLGVEPGTEDTRVEVHLRLAQAAVAASRWPMAAHHLEAARQLLPTDHRPAARARLEVLRADLAVAQGDTEEARRLAEGVLDIAGAGPDVGCHALEIIGRSFRLHDLRPARAAFDRALLLAETANLPVWRMRALHELGTIDLLDHAGVDRLAAAQRAAEQMGALSTAAILDLQLAAAFTCRWELDLCDRHARSAVTRAERLGLDLVRSKALSLLTGSAAMRADDEATEHYAALTMAAAPDDAMLDAFCWGNRGLLAVLRGEELAAVEPFGRGMAILARLPQAEPAAFRAFWPLLLASVADRRAPRAIDEARRLGVGSSNLNRGLLGYAEAVLAGRAGEAKRAGELAAVADRNFANCEPWAELARYCAAGPAGAGGWGDPARWRKEASAGFARRGLDRLARRCDDLAATSAPNPWASLGVTAREADVLRLVVQGLANKQIAARLQLSPRTVEKHLESLLRKTGAQSRTELAVAAASGTT